MFMKTHDDDIPTFIAHRIYSSGPRFTTLDKPNLQHRIHILK